MPQSKKKIPNDTIVALYPVLRKIGKGEITRAIGIRTIAAQFDMNLNSARDFVENFLKMLKGEKYQRLNTIFQTDLYLRMIEKDFGKEALQNAVSSVQQHLAYYQGVSGNKQRGIREVMAKYANVAPTEVALTHERIANRATELAEGNEFDPENEEDAREWVVTSIARRQGQPKFRERLLRLYRGRCAISGCRVTQVLEAAHIQRYLGLRTNHSTNGLLLRSDLHTLFDYRLISINTATMTVLVSPELSGTIYERTYSGRKLSLPKYIADRPSIKALDKHREECGLKEKV